MTQADGLGKFTFGNVALAPGSQAFIAVASDLAGNSSQLNQAITTTASDASAPVIVAALANDTGLSATDGITSDATISGTVDDPSGVGAFRASLDGGPFVDVRSLLIGVGFTFSAANLATIHGGAPIADGPHTLALLATDSLGHASAASSLSFALDSVRPLPPAGLHLLPGDLTGTSQAATRSRSFTVELSSPAGTLVTLYMNGAAVSQLTAGSGPLDFPIAGPLADGQYLFTATAGTASGLASPFSTPFTVTVTNTTPAIRAFGLDALSDARPYGHNLTMLQVVGFAGQTIPGALVKLVETGAQTTSDASGKFAFYPVNLPNLGDFTFTLQVTDVAGNVNTLARTFTRIDNTLPANLLPPDVTLNLSATTARLGDSVMLTVSTQTHDGQPLANDVLLINGRAYPLNPDGTATFSSATPGVFSLTVKAFDAEGNEGDATRTLTFLTPPNGLPAPVAGIGGDQVTPVVTLPTPIIGTANTASLLQYTLQYTVEGQGNWVTFATGTTAVVNGVLGTIDPTLLQNGFYDIRLSVEDTGGQVTTSDKVYQVDGQAKIGNFTLSFQDVNIANQGFPITATRTYDSRVKGTQGDFGFGWNLSTTDVKVESSSVLGAAFIQTETQLPATQVDPLGGLGGGLGGFGGLPGIGLPPGLGSRPAEIQYSFRNTQNDYVTISLPDGTKEQFIMGFTGITYNFAGPPLATTSVFYLPLAGTGSSGTLEALTNNNVIVSPAQVGPVNFIDQTTGQVYNPTRWKYTAQDGSVYTISNSRGLENVSDSNGNAMSFDAGGARASDGLGMTIIRDPQGRISTIIDPAGGTVRYGYDFYGDLVTVTDQLGNITRLTYDNNHTLGEIYDPLGRRGVRNEYDANGRLITTVDGVGNRVEYLHDIGARQEVTKDRLGNQTVMTYDASGNVLSTTDALGHTTSYTYDAMGNELTTTDPIGNVSRFTYDSKGHLETSMDALGEVTRYGYNAAGQVLATTDPMGRVARSGYDSRGNLTTATDALGETTTFAYDSRGNLLSKTDALNNTTGYAYDIFGRLLRVTDPLGNVTSFTYDLLGNLLTTTTTRANADGVPMTATTSKRYDAKGQAIMTTDAAGFVTSDTYSPIGKISQQSESNGAGATYTYDVAGRIVRTTYADGTYDATTYDAEGRRLTSTDQSGKITRFAYNAVGQLIQATDPDGRTISYTLDADGRTIGTVDGNNNRTSYTYDAGTTFLANADLRQLAPAKPGRVTSVTDSQGATTGYAYDADGNKTSTKLADGSVTSYGYDALNRTTSVALPGGSTTTTSFNSAGKTMSETLPDGTTTTYGYDAAGSQTTVADALGNVTHLTYDSLGNLLTETDPKGGTTSWEYDASGRDPPYAAARHVRNLHL